MEGADIIGKDGLVGGELEEGRVGCLVWDRGEVAVVKRKPLLCPRGTARLADAGLAVLAGNSGAIGKLGLLSAEARAVLPGAAQCVGSREGDDLHVTEAHAVEDLAEVTVGSRVLGRGRASSTTVLASGAGLGEGGEG